MEDNAERVATFVMNKIMLLGTWLFLGISLIEMKDFLQVLSLIFAIIASLLSILFLILNNKNKIPLFKERVKKEIEKNCPPEVINEKETQ